MAQGTPSVPIELAPLLPRLERRGAERYRCGRRPVVRILTRPALQTLKAVVEEVSTAGIRLLITCPLPPGTLLGLGLQSTRPSLIQSARVVHAAPAGEGNWVIGCKLTAPLSPSELAFLLE
jgi:hypothetical protein